MRAAGLLYGKLFDGSVPPMPPPLSAWPHNISSMGGLPRSQNAETKRRCCSSAQHTDKKGAVARTVKMMRVSSYICLARRASVRLAMPLSTTCPQRRYRCDLEKNANPDDSQRYRGGLPRPSSAASGTSSSARTSGPDRSSRLAPAPRMAAPRTARGPLGTCQIPPIMGQIWVYFPQRMARFPSISVKI